MIEKMVKGGNEVLDHFIKKSKDFSEYGTFSHILAFV